MFKKFVNAVRNCAHQAYRAVRAVAVGAGVAAAATFGGNVKAALIPTLGTLSSTELSGLQTYGTDLTTIMTWGVVAILGVVGVSLLIRVGRKVWAKFNP